MKKRKLLKPAILAVGIIISAAFYVLSDEGSALIRENSEVIYPEDALEEEKIPDESTDEFEAVPADTDADMDDKTADALMSDDEFSGWLKGIIHEAVREELVNISSEDYLKEAFAASAEYAAEEAEKKKDMVNINQAGQEELMTLDGIGEKRALDIIEYREKHGGFSSPEDIKNVDGIKESVYTKIKDKIYT